MLVIDLQRANLSFDERPGERSDALLDLLRRELGAGRGLARGVHQVEPLRERRVRTFDVGAFDHRRALVARELSCRFEGWTSNAVTTPKLPPTPRIAQKRSGSFDALTTWTAPSAVTASAARRLSIVMP